MDVTLFLDETGQWPNGDSERALGLRALGGPLCEGHPDALAARLRALINPAFATWRLPRHASEYSNLGTVTWHRRRFGFPETLWNAFWQRKRALNTSLPPWSGLPRTMQREAIERGLLKLVPYHLGKIMAQPPVRGVVLCVEHDREAHAGRWMPMARSATRRALLALLPGVATRVITLHVQAELGHSTDAALGDMVASTVGELAPAFAARGTSLRAGRVQIDPGKNKGHQGLVLADAVTYFLGPRAQQLVPLSTHEAECAYHRKEFGGRYRRQFGGYGTPLWLCGAYGASDALVRVAAGELSLPTQPDPGELIAAVHDLQSLRDQLQLWPLAQGDA